MPGEPKTKRRGQVRERGPGVFLIRVPLRRDPLTGRRVYHNETFRGTRPKAEKRCTQILAQTDDGSYFRPSNMTVEELIRRWLKHAATRDVKRVTLDMYEYKCREYIIPAVGGVPLADLTPLALQDMFDALTARGLAPLTVRNARSVFSHAMKYALKLRLVKDNPLREVETPKARRRPKRAMDEREAARFVSAAREKPEDLIFILWLFTGLRPVEFIGLRWADVEMVEGQQGRAYGVAHVRQTVVRVKGGGWEFSTPKTEKGTRPVYFPSWLYFDLMDHKRRQDEYRASHGGYRDHGFVFASRSGEPLHRANLAARRLKPLLKRAGLPEEYSLYTLRRSFASLLRRAGVDRNEVSEQMGHTNVQFTEDVYVTVYDSAKREMSDALEKALSQGSCTQDAHNEGGAVM